MSKARELANLGNAYSDGALSNRNVIANGAMIISQRGTSFTSVGNGNYTLDRFRLYSSGGGVFNVDQASDGPDDFTKSLKVTVATNDASIGASDYYMLNHRIEGYSTSHFNFGTSAAKTVTLSFYVKSSLTGTFGGSFTNSSEANAYIFSYTINTANTWERKTVTITGQTSGTWSTDNTNSIRIYWDLGCGSGNVSGSSGWGSGGYGLSGTTQLVGTASATWQITGVQLEVGDTATPFEHRSYGEELARCQRYYFEARKGSYPEAYHYYARTNIAVVGNVPFPVTMRATPSVTLNSNGVDNRAVRVNTAALVTFSPVQSWWTKDAMAGLYDDVNTPFVSGESYGIGIKADAEL